MVTYHKNVMLIVLCCATAYASSETAELIEEDKRSPKLSYETFNPFNEFNPFDPYDSVDKRNVNLNGEDDAQRNIRSPLGTMRFGKRNPLGTMRFGKRAPLGTMRFGKRSPFGTMRFGKRTFDEFESMKRAPLGTMRFGK